MGCLQWARHGGRFRGQKERKMQHQLCLFKLRDGKFLFNFSEHPKYIKLLSKHF